jgi:hypothetical protein
MNTEGEKVLRCMMIAAEHRESDEQLNDDYGKQVFVYRKSQKNSIRYLYRAPRLFRPSTRNIKGVSLLT